MVTTGRISLMFFGHPQAGENIRPDNRGTLDELACSDMPRQNWYTDALTRQSADADSLDIRSRDITKGQAPEVELQLIVSLSHRTTTPSTHTYTHINKRSSLPTPSHNSRPEQNYDDNGGSIRGGIRTRWKR